MGASVFGATLMIFLAVDGCAGEKMTLLWKQPKPASYYAKIAKLAIGSEAHMNAKEQQEYERAKHFNVGISRPKFKANNQDQSKQPDYHSMRLLNTFKIYRPTKYHSPNEFYSNWRRDQPSIYSRPTIVEGVVRDPFEDRLKSETTVEASAADNLAAFKQASPEVRRRIDAEKKWNDRRVVPGVIEGVAENDLEAVKVDDAFPLPVDSIFNEKPIVPVQLKSVGEDHKAADDAHTAGAHKSVPRRGVTFVDNSESESAPTVWKAPPAPIPVVPVAPKPRARSRYNDDKWHTAKEFRAHPYNYRFKIRAQSGRNVTYIERPSLRKSYAGYEPKPHGEVEGAHCLPRSTDTYDRNKWICCNNSLKPRLDSWMTSCCGGETYDPKRNICCGGRLRVKRNRKQMCCGDRAYNPESFVCCSGRVNFAGKSGRHRRRTHVCCGKWTYNPANQICCSGIISRRTKGFRSCCKTNPYNPYSHSCCNDGIRPKYQGCVSWGRRLY